MSKIKITLPENFKFPKNNNLMAKAWTSNDTNAFCEEMEKILSANPNISNVRLASLLESKFNRRVDLHKVIIPIMKASGLMENSEGKVKLKRV